MTYLTFLLRNTTCIYIFIWVECADTTKYNKVDLIVKTVYYNKLELASNFIDWFMYIFIINITNLKVDILFYW